MKHFFHSEFQVLKTSQSIERKINYKIGRGEIGRAGIVQSALLQFRAVLELLWRDVNMLRARLLLCISG
jgi:hypothetical protein